MGLDRDKVVASAEKNIRAGRTDAALTELRRLASASPNDPSLLNRIGDLLARARHVSEAIEYYDRAADRFARSGLYPKAIAVGKKVLRLNSDRVETLTHVGEWYLAQKLPGEARSFLLHAADQHLEAKQFDRAREIYERLVETDGADPRHRARLAEALAAEGKHEEAGNHLLALASSSQVEARETIYRRAMELLPDNDAPVRGLLGVLAASDRDGDAVDFLVARARDGGLSDVLRAELALLYDRTGRPDDALEQLAHVDPIDLPVGLVERIVRGRVERGGADAFWECFDRRVRPAATEPEARDAAIRLLECLAGVETSGHAAALERLVAWREAGGGAPPVDVLERLREALAAAGRDAAAADVAERIDELRRPEPQPDRERPEAADADPDETPGAEEHELEPVATDAATARRPGIDLPVDVEAPAVPLNRSDEDFVAGRLTQAEILEKYGLAAQAIEQVREVVQRFPGHLDALSRLVRLLEDGGSAADVRDALVRQAYALRAAGDPDGARRSSRRAAESAPLDDETAKSLAALGLYHVSDEPAETAEAAGEEPSDVEGSAAADELVEAGPAEQASDDGSEGEIVIDFDDDGGLPAAEEATDPPVADVAVAAATDESPPSDPVPVEPMPTDEPSPPAQPGASAAEEQDDLAILAQALESELFDGSEGDGWLPESAEEQSLDEVMSAFRERVQEEVGDEDFQTHYDLAIGYKEMGMLDEAVSSFELAARSPDLRIESLILMAVIRREQGQTGEAIRLYRDALTDAASDVAATRRLRYDLADTLAQAGDEHEALAVFRQLHEADPHFRDVEHRVAEIERRLHG